MPPAARAAGGACADAARCALPSVPSLPLPRRVTFEYTLLAGVNDQLRHAGGWRAAQAAAGWAWAARRAGPSPCLRPPPSRGPLPSLSRPPAEELATLLRRHDLRSHVNLIPWNPVDESGALGVCVRRAATCAWVHGREQGLGARHCYAPLLTAPPSPPLLPPCLSAEFQRPTRRAVQQFASVLESAGVPVSLRHTRGLEAAAACGQLRNQHQQQPLPEFAVPL